MGKTTVNRLGFEFKFANNISVTDFYKKALEYNEKSITYQSTSYFIYVSFLKDVLAGQIIKYKDDEHFLESKKDPQGNLLVSKRSTTKGFKGTEAATFVINPTSGKGLLDTYMSSVSPHIFGKILSKIHSDVRRGLINSKAEELISLDEELSRKEAKSNSRSHFSGEFQFNLLMTNNDFSELSKTIKYVKKIIVDFEPALVSGTTFSPLLEIAKKGKIEVSVQENTSINSISKELSNMYSSIKGERSKLKFLGQLHSGQDIQRELGDNLQYFGKQSYDDYIKSLPEKLWKNYIYSASINSLITAISQYSAVMGKVPKIENWSNNEFDNVVLLTDTKKAANDGQ